MLALPIEQLGGCPRLGLELGRRREIEAIAAPAMRYRPVDERHALPGAPAGPAAAQPREEVAQEARLSGAPLRRGRGCLLVGPAPGPPLNECLIDAPLGLGPRAVPPTARSSPNQKWLTDFPTQKL